MLISSRTRPTAPVISAEDNTEGERHGGTETRLGPGLAWSSLSGYTSFIAHSGGPPIAVYLLPQRMDKTIFAGTTVVYFLVLNYAKLGPYYELGLLNGQNPGTSLVLAPLAPVGVVLGMWLNKKVPTGLFYRICYGLLFATGTKLVYDGGMGMLG